MQREEAIRKFRFVRLIRRCLRGDLDQLIPAPNGMLSQHGDTREHTIPLADPRLAGAEALEVSLFGRQQVEERGCDGAVRPGRRHLQLLVGEPGAHVKEVQVRPLVVTKSLDEERLHRPILVRSRL